MVEDTSSYPIGCIYLHNSALIIFVDSRYYLAYHPNIPRWIETQFYNYKNVIAWIKSFGFIGDNVEGMTKVLGPDRGYNAHISWCNAN